MASLGPMRHTWQIRTSVDPRRPFDAKLLATLQAIQQKEGISESRAVMQLLWLGWHAYDRADLPEATCPHADPTSTSERPSRVRIARVGPTERARSDALNPGMADAANGEPALGAERAERHTALESAGSHAAPGVPAPATVAAPQAIEALQPAAGGLKRLRTMMLSQSVIPPGATAPRGTSHTVEAQTLSPAILASTIAKFNASDGRQL